jgi:hypothetical protein
VLFALELLVKILSPHLYYLYRKCQNTTFEAVLIVYSLPYLLCWYSCVARIFLRIQQQVNIGNVSWKWTPPCLSKNLHLCHSRMVVPFNWAPIPERSWEPQSKKHIKDCIILFTDQVQNHLQKSIHKYLLIPHPYSSQLSASNTIDFEVQCSRFLCGPLY